MNFFLFIPLSIALLLLAGCATPSPQASLPGVQIQLSERAGINATWPLTPEDRATADTRVRELLAADLTVESTVQIALLNNRSLRATFEELGLSQAGLAAATRLPNPSFEVSVRWPQHPPRGPNVEFGLSAPLLEALLLPARKNIAQNQLLQTQYRVSHEVLALVAEVRRAAYEVMAQQDLRIRLAVIAEINRVSADFGRRQFDAGNISKLDVAQLEASAQQTQVELARADAAIGSARERLNRLLGLSSSQANWKLAASLPDLPSGDALPENLAIMAQQQRLDLAALLTQSQLAQKAVNFKSRTRLLPGEVNLGVDTERDTGGQRVTGPRLALQLPLFDQGQTELARLSAELRQVQDRAEALSAEIGSEVRAARGTLTAARRAVEFYQQTLLPQRRAILRESLLHYNAMQKSVYELLTAKEQQQLTERDSVEALRDYWLARTELERAFGRRLPELAQTQPESPANEKPKEPETEPTPEPHHHSAH